MADQGLARLTAGRPGIVAIGGSRLELGLEGGGCDDRPVVGEHQQSSSPATRIDEASSASDTRWSSPGSFERRGGFGLSSRISADPQTDPLLSVPWRTLARAQCPDTGVHHVLRQDIGGLSWTLFELCGKGWPETQPPFRPAGWSICQRPSPAVLTVFAITVAAPASVMPSRERRRQVQKSNARATAARTSGLLTGWPSICSPTCRPRLQRQMPQEDMLTRATGRRPRAGRDR